jgi:8-oxo-dGTP pyrophosphatase MutT (NUDIX family)
MHTIIYFNQKPLVLATELSEDVKKIQEQPGVSTIEEKGFENVEDLVKEIQKVDNNGLIVLTHNADALLDTMKQQLKLIVAAGGCVHTDESTVLLIFRKGKWDLPKGKLDEAEKLEDCAVREMKEETGLENVTLEKPLTITYHTYYEKGDLILKESYWYLMKSPQQQVLTPQTEEDIMECKWVKLDELAPYLDNTHPSIIDVLQIAVKELKAQKEI